MVPGTARDWAQATNTCTKPQPHYPLGRDQKILFVKTLKGRGEDIRSGKTLSGKCQRHAIQRLFRGRGGGAKKSAEKWESLARNEMHMGRSNPGTKNPFPIWDRNVKLPCTDTVNKTQLWNGSKNCSEKLCSNHWEGGWGA